MLIKFLTKLIHLHLYIESSVRIIFLILNLPIQEDNVSTFNFLNVLQWGFAVFPYSLHLFIFVPTVNAIYLSVIDIFCLLLVGRKATDYFLIWILHSAISATLIISNNLLILLHFQWRKSPLAKKKVLYFSFSHYFISISCLSTHARIFRAEMVIVIFRTEMVIVSLLSFSWF